jgi:SprT-like protein
VQHELTHYHLYREGRGYQHRDAEFKALLAQVGGLRFAPNLPNVKFYRYTCQKCGSSYKRRRKIAIQKYRCGKCAGQLRSDENERS